MTTAAIGAVCAVVLVVMWRRGAAGLGSVTIAVVLGWTIGQGTGPLDGAISTAVSAAQTALDAVSAVISGG